jgi:dTDP-glucose 4,6-dehydratase
VALFVTGGMGFIGSNYVRHLARSHPDEAILNYDKLTYAGNPANLEGLQHPRYLFIKGDICDGAAVAEALGNSEAIVNFAAATHVDRSIADAEDFIETNVRGTHVLLEAARRRDLEFCQISTDEGYGSIEEGSFREEDALQPSSPYSASKAAADLLCLAYHRTYGLPVRITRSTNNFGPYQFPEKFVPLMITNALQGRPLPIYGDGLNVRDWIYVEDNCEAIDLVRSKGRPGEVYNIGAGNERTNLEVAKAILGILGCSTDLLRFVKDRPGHDRRYSVDTAKVGALGWRPRRTFEEALAATVEWYRRREDWWRPLVRAPSELGEQP